MRADIARHKPPASAFDVKLVDGGLVDCEFTIHVLQLLHHVGIDTRLGNAATALAEAGLLNLDIVKAHAFLARLLVTQRLVSPESTEPPDASKAIVARACGVADWTALVRQLDMAREVVRSEWQRVTQSG